MGSGMVPSMFRSVRAPSHDADAHSKDAPACKLIAKAVQLRNDLRDYLNRRAVDGASLHGVDTQAGGSGDAPLRAVSALPPADGCRLDVLREMCGAAGLPLPGLRRHLASGSTLLPELREGPRRSRQ